MRAATLRCSPRSAVLYLQNQIISLGVAFDIVNGTSDSRCAAGQWQGSASMPVLESSDAEKLPDRRHFPSFLQTAHHLAWLPAFPIRIIGSSPPLPSHVGPFGVSH